MSQEQDFQEIEEEYEAEENAKHDMRMRRMGEILRVFSDCFFA